jgi:hypothetical protein
MSATMPTVATALIGYSPRKPDSSGSTEGALLHPATTASSTKPKIHGTTRGTAFTQEKGISTSWFSDIKITILMAEIFKVNGSNAIFLFMQVDIFE